MNARETEGGLRGNAGVSLTEAAPLAGPHLVLSGMMGAGKSTVGRLAASSAGARFVDMDEAVLAMAGGLTIKTPMLAGHGGESMPPGEPPLTPAELPSVADLFARLGEPAFRRLEAEALARALAEDEPTVIAAGGGALVDPGSRDLALRRAHVVTLTAPVDELLGRARRPGQPRRPLLDALPRLLAERAAVYAEAHATLATEGRDPEVIAEAALRAWRAPALMVRLGARSYPVRLTGPATAGALVADTLAALRPSQWYLVTDTTVDGLWGAAFLEEIASARGAPPAATVRLEPGEREKHLAAVERALTALVDAGADRDAVVVAHGGGVVSDIAGFAAAILLRGVRWISVPTTLLSMADAAIGGKTGVDLGRAKNAAGAFHQPCAVILDARRAATETGRAVASGLAEIVKAGALADPEILALLERAPLPVPLPLLEQLVARAASVKAAIVGQDEREGGPRALLNFGHTLGHALEAAGAFERWTHGEAVSLGMVGALSAGRALGLTDPSAAERLRALLGRLGLPIALTRADIEAALPYLSLDKKRRGTTVKAIFITTVGRPVIHPIALDDLSRLYLESVP